MSSTIVQNQMAEAKRYFDRQRQAWMVRVVQGNYQVTSDPSVIYHTILGSCISACIRDPLAGIGGMNHFLLPSGDTSAAEMASGAASRYGTYAMELLVNAILSRGGSRSRLEVKLFGGGNVVKGIEGMGHKNADFIEEFVKLEKLHVASKHLRGDAARRVEYNPHTGKARMLLVSTDATEAVVREEVKRSVRVDTSAAGDIELFD